MDDTHGFAVRCTFDPTPAFEPFCVLFSEDARLAYAVTTDPDPALLEAADAVLDSILALKLGPRGQDDRGLRPYLISIEGDTADVRPLTPEEEPL